ncbi:hypothetical protein ABBQ38_002056 [Trebouxia sp. C0009 RCD-2024]
MNTSLLSTFQEFQSSGKLCLEVQCVLSIQNGHWHRNDASCSELIKVQNNQRIRGTEESEKQQRYRKISAVVLVSSKQWSHALNVNRSLRTWSLFAKHGMIIVTFGKCQQQ